MVELVYTNITFILAFLILTLFIDMISNGKLTYGFLWLVLLSMVVVNADKFSSLVGKGFSV